MDIARIEIPYPEYQAMSDEQVAELREALFIHPIFSDSHELKFEESTEKPGLWRVEGWRNSFIVDLDKIDKLPVTIRARLRNDIAIQKAIESRPPAFNERVQVSVPGNELMKITEVHVFTDMCTEELQREMTENKWRILAICPQPDQRRPDYIMGK